MTDDVFPDRNMEHMDKLAWVIEDQGWVADPVEADAGPPPRPGYTYTIGFETAFDRPEVVIFGLQAVAARGLLGMIADQHRGGVVLPVDGVFVDCRVRSSVRPAHRRPRRAAARFPDASAFHAGRGVGADRWRMLQFVWPDRNGRLPWDQDYDPRLRVAQPVIGT